MGASSGEKESQGLPGLKQQGHARSSGFDEESTARSFCVGGCSVNEAKAPGTSDMVATRGGGFCCASTSRCVAALSCVLGVSRSCAVEGRRACGACAADWPLRFLLQRWLATSEERNKPRVAPLRHSYGSAANRAS